MLNRIENTLVAANRLILILLLIAMSFIVFANVVLRYTTGDSLIWGEEVSRHMMIWATFLGAGLVLRMGGHVAIDNLHKAVPTRAARLLRFVVAAVVVVFCLSMLVASTNYAYAMRFQTTPATGVSFSYIYAALPTGFALMLVHLAFIVRQYVSEGRFVESDEMDAESAASL